MVEQTIQENNLVKEVSTAVASAVFNNKRELGSFVRQELKVYCPPDGSVSTAYY